MGVLVLEVGARSLDNIFTTSSRLGCTKHFSFCLQRRETVDLHPKKTSIGFLSLSLSGKHIHWHSHEKARILAYWLSKKEEKEAQLTAATRQLLAHHSLSRIAPRYSRRFTKWLSDTIYRTYHSLFWPLVRCVKYQLQLEGESKGGETAPYDIHVTFTSLFFKMYLHVEGTVTCTPRKN